MLVISLRFFSFHLLSGLAFLGSITSVSAQKTVIKITPATVLGQIQPELYGTNHRYTNNGSTMWDPVKHQAIPAFTRIYNEIGLRSMRYPAGTAASLFHWKRSIGPLKKRTDAIEGHSWENETKPAPTNFGLDEAARFCEANNTKLNYMYNFGNGNAADAADLVEYLNTPVGKNPNGGVAWAEVRARNGHPEPYHIVTFEMGNEMYRNARQHYWLDGISNKTYEEKYCFGDTVKFFRQPLGEYASNALNAQVITSPANKVKYVKYPVVLAGTDTVFIDNIAWKKVRTLKNAGKANVYTLDEVSGRIEFGDGVHGNNPYQRGAKNQATVSYTAKRDGLDDYYRAMKAVDSGVKVYSCLIDTRFIETMGQSPYDGIGMHPYAGFWNLPKSGLPLSQMNDLVMLIADEETDSIKNTLAHMQKTVSPERRAAMRVINSEYGIAHNDIAPNYQPSIAQALYSATILFGCIEQDVPVGSKHSLTGGVIGNAPHFLKTPTAHMFTLFTKHFGQTRIASSVENNPSYEAVGDNTRKLHNNGILEKLKLNATKDASGNVYIMVVNRNSTDEVKASIELPGYSFTDKNATVLTLAGDSFHAFNTVEDPNNVVISEAKLAVNNTFDYTFPAHSITTIKLKGKVN